MRVLVFGGGAAASAVAIALAERDHEVVLAGPVEPSRWPMLLDGGIDVGDPDEGLSASLRCGDYLAPRDAVAAMWEQAPRLSWWLEGALGVPFHHDAGHPALRRLPGSPSARARYVEGRTELCISETLELAALRRGVTLREPFELVELAVIDGAVVGAVLEDHEGALEPIAADAVVIAAGGPEKKLRGDLGAIATERAVAVALRAGAVGADLDLVQDHPTALWRDGVPTVLSPAWRSEGAILWLPDEPTDARRGRDIPGRERRRPLAEDHPGWAELAPDDLGAAALRRAFEAGGGIYDRKRREVRRRAYLDLSHLPERIFQSRLRAEIIACARRFGAEPGRAPLIVAPARLGGLGGLWVRPRGPQAHAASLTGLFAVGGAAALYHGICRMGGAGLLADLAGALRAAESVTAYAPGVSERAAKEALAAALERARRRGRGRNDGAEPADAFAALVVAAREGDLEAIARLRDRGVRPGPRGPAAVTPSAFDDLLFHAEAALHARGARSPRRRTFLRFARHGFELLDDFELDGERVEAAGDAEAPPRRYGEEHG